MELICIFFIRTPEKYFYNWCFFFLLKTLEKCNNNVPGPKRRTMMKWFLYVPLRSTGTLIVCIFLLRTPEKYYDLKLPHKLPPAKEPLPTTGLPMLGYMEQSCATALVKALTACGNFKPKYPFLSSSRSALMYVAYHLKGKHRQSTVSDFHWSWASLHAMLYLDNQTCYWKGCYIMLAAH